jgi:hypothetical protein
VCSLFEVVNSTSRKLSYIVVQRSLVNVSNIFSIECQVILAPVCTTRVLVKIH